jgi:hypothetical protein
LCTRCGHALFESGDALGERSNRGVGIKTGEADERDLEWNARIKGVGNTHECIAERFERTGGSDRPETSGLIGDAGPIGIGESGEIGADRGKEHITELRDERLAQDPRIATSGECTLDGDQRPRRLSLAERFDEFIDGVVAIRDPAGSHDSIEGGEGVAGRTGPGAQNVGATFGTQFQTGIGDDVVNESFEIGC